MADESEGQNGDGVRRLKHTSSVSNPPTRTHTHTEEHQRSREKIKTEPANLRVNGERFGLAEVVRTVDHMVVKIQRYVAVLLVQWARDVEFLVDHLKG